MYDSLTRMKVTIKFLSLGVVPMGGGDGAYVWFDFNRILKDLPPAEARAMKRKFRKLWRSIVSRAESHGGKKGRHLARTTKNWEVTGGAPSKSQRAARKQLVSSAVWKAVSKEGKERP